MKASSGSCIPSTSTTSVVAFAVLVIAVVLEELLAADRHRRVERLPRAAPPAGWPSSAGPRPPGKLPIVLLEDTAALSGLAFALLGVALAVITGNGQWEAAPGPHCHRRPARGGRRYPRGRDEELLLIGESAGRDIERDIVARH